MRHIHMAQHYFQAMRSKNSQESERFRKPIELCLQDLDLIRRVTLPDPKVIKMIYPLYRQGQSPSLSPSSHQVTLDSSPRLLLQQVLDIGSMDAEIKQLTWCPIGVNLRQLPEGKLLAIIESLRAWKNAHAVLFHRFEVDEALSDPVNFNFTALDKLPIPPTPHLILPKDYCLALALYSFYRARLLWALSIHHHGESNLELDAYHFIYQFLRFVQNGHRHSTINLPRQSPRMRSPKNRVLANAFPCWPILRQTSMASLDIIRTRSSWPRRRFQ